MELYVSSSAILNYQFKSQFLQLIPNLPLLVGEGQVKTCAAIS
jgi:hypothetical protein